LEFTATTKKSGRRLLTAETPRVHYSGKEDQGLNPLNPEAENPKYLVGIVENGTVTLHDANLFRMEPTIKALESIATVELTLSGRDKIMMAREDLVQSFGGKKKRQAAAAETRYKVDADALRSGTTLIKQASETDKNRRLSEVGTDSDEGKSVPPFDKKAKKARDIYPFNKLISVKNLKMIETHSLYTALGGVNANNLAKLRSNPESDVSRVSETAFTTIENAVKSGQLDPQKKKTLVYIEYLFKLRKVFKERTARFSRSQVLEHLEDYPDAFVGVSLNVFTEKSSGNHRMTAYLKDMLVAHIIVLYLHLNNFQPVATLPVADDLKQPNAKIQENFRSCGCTISKDKATNSFFASLKAPLTFPKKLGRAV